VTAIQYIYQSNSHTGAITIIRIIRNSCEKKQFTDDDVLIDFLPDVAIRGPNVLEIENYWQKYNNLYEYKRYNMPTVEIDQKISLSMYWAMVVSSTPTPYVFHCVLLEEIIDNQVRFWNPQIGLQYNNLSKFDDYRKNNGSLLEIHFLRYKK